MLTEALISARRHLAYPSLETPEAGTGLSRGLEGEADTAPPRRARLMRGETCGARLSLRALAHLATRRPLSDASLCP